MESFLAFLECPECRERYDAHQLQTVCRCGSPLLARYDLERARTTLSPDLLADRPADLWRYAELLPVQDPSQIVTLGEGGTPLLRADRLAEALGMSHLYIKDESGNPTGSFKARGLAMAVSRARELGVHSFVIPTAGNAGGALAAYAARAGLTAHVFMPADAPPHQPDRGPAGRRDPPPGRGADLRRRPGGRSDGRHRGRDGRQHAEGTLPAGGQEDDGV